MRNNLLAVLCTIAVLGGLAVSSQAQTKPAVATGASTKAKGSAWEYTTLVRGKYFDTNTSLLGRWTDWTTTLGDADVTDPKLALGDYLNRLGADGWELVSASPLHGDGDRVMYYVFKRPKH